MTQKLALRFFSFSFITAYNVMKCIFSFTKKKKGSKIQLTPNHIHKYKNLEHEKTYLYSALKSRI